MNFFTCYGQDHSKEKQYAFPPNRKAIAIRRMILMRINCIALFLLVAIMNVCASVHAQNIDLSFRQTPLKKALAEIQKQSGYRVAYNNKHLSKSHAVTFTISNGQLKEVLEKCFQDQPLTYEIIEKTIVVKPRPKAETIFEKVSNYLRRLRITGTVTDEKSQPIAGVTVRVKGTYTIAITGSDGKYSIDADEKAVLQFSYIGFSTIEQPVGKNSVLNITLNSTVAELNQIDVVSTGYQKIPRERATGSFEFIDNELINRRISSNILDKIENVASGFYVNQNDVGPDKYLIRGRSTLFADAIPLIVIDNFPYDGSIDDINPNDIESVSILKDAAAASIWGARAGNGVIVLTTKRGKSSQHKVEITSNITLLQKPDLQGLPRISGEDFIELEKKLFSLGFYKADEDLNTQGFAPPPFTPVIELLRKKRDGAIDPATADAQIEGLKQNDILSDLDKYFYRNSFSHRHSLSLSGGSSKMDYYLSAGLDKEPTTLISESSRRISLRNQNTFRVSNRFEIDAGLNFIQNSYETGNNTGYIMGSTNTSKTLYPYARLADDAGNPLPVFWDFNQAFLESATGQGLMDWTNSPLEEINRRNYKSTERQLVANTGVTYKIVNGLAVSLKYQYLYAQVNLNDQYNRSSFYVRNLVNKYTQINSDGDLIYPIPIGDILTKQNSETFSHQVRAQVNYNKEWAGKHKFDAIVGAEVKDLKGAGYSSLFYGYDKKGSVVNSDLDYKTLFPQYQYGENAAFVTATIPGNQSISGTLDRYVSYYANASYSYQDRYVASASARTDASNLFGVKTNQKEVPLWSAGLAWIINRESFYNLSWLPLLKVRATYGTQGNVYKNATAYTTTRVKNPSLFTGYNIQEITSPPNTSLRWETIGMLDLGIDFSLKNDRLSGSVDYYHKKGTDLFGQAPLDPTTGMQIQDGAVRYFGNLAGIRGRGIDVKLHSNVIKTAVSWSVDFLYNYSISEVSKYEAPVSALGRAYLGDYMINPVLGESVYSIYAYPWAGLNPANGNPRGYVNGQISEDYSAIYNQTPLSEMKAYSLQPNTFGSFRNTFGYKDILLSFNISYKLNYYFRKPSVNYGQLFNTWNGHSDYAYRWQKPGDETNTDVPSFIYPANNFRDSFYTYSDALIERGDHIRLEDINLSYVIKKGQGQRLPFQSLRLSAYVTNIGLLWAANNSGIDPNATYSLRPGRSYSFGVNVTF